MLEVQGDCTSLLGRPLWFCYGSTALPQSEDCSLLAEVPDK